MTATTTNPSAPAALTRAWASVTGFFVALGEIIDEAQRLREETFERLGRPIE